MSILLHLRARWALKAQLIPLPLNLPPSLSLSALSARTGGLSITVVLFFLHLSLHICKCLHLLPLSPERNLQTTLIVFVEISRFESKRS